MFHGHVPRFRRFAAAGPELAPDHRARPASLACAIRRAGSRSGAPSAVSGGRRCALGLLASGILTGGPLVGCGGDASGRAPAPQTRVDLAPNEAATPDGLDAAEQREVRDALRDAFADRAGEADGSSYVRGVRWGDLPGLVSTALDDPAIGAAVVRQVAADDGRTWRIELRTTEGGPGLVVLGRRAPGDELARAAPALARGDLADGSSWALEQASIGRFPGDAANRERVSDFVRALDDAADRLAQRTRLRPIESAGADG